MIVSIEDPILKMNEGKAYKDPYSLLQLMEEPIWKVYNYDHRLRMLNFITTLYMVFDIYTGPNQNVL